MARNRTPKEAAPSKEAAIETGGLCPVCGSSDTASGFNGSTRGAEGRIDNSTSGCYVCYSMWQEAYYRRTGETVVSDIRPKALEKAYAADKAYAAQVKQAAQQQALADKQDGAGCPLCKSIHVAIKPHGNAAASCCCVDCGCLWDQRYVAAEGRAYQSNIKAS